MATLSGTGGRERLVHEGIIAHELVSGVSREGLRFQSVNPRWIKASATFRGYPLVGYSARQNLPPIIIRAASSLPEHLLAVEREARDPDLILLRDEFVTKDDFRNWLVHAGKPMPAFWFGTEERRMEA